jgi:hypothetical protein
MFDLHAVSHVIPNGAPGKTGRLLEDKGQIVFFWVGYLPVNIDIALGGRNQLGKAVQKCGFTAPCRPDDRQKFSFGNGEVDVIQNQKIAKSPGQIFDFNFVSPA